MPAPTSYSVQSACLMLPEGKAAKRSNPSGQRHQPGRQLLGRFQPLVREVVARAEKHHAPLAFVDAELERRQGKGTDMADERCFLLRADEVTLVVQPLGPRAFIGEHA